MKKWGAVLIGLVVLAMPFVLMAVQQGEIDAIKTTIADHDVSYKQGNTSSVESIQMQADSTYEWHFYIENRGIVVVHLLADVLITLTNGTVIANMTLDDSDYNIDFLFDELPSGPEISYETILAWRSQSMMNATIKITCQDVGFWRYHLYENIRPTIFAEYDVLQKVLGINTILVILAVIILGMGLWHVAAWNKTAKHMPEKPWLQAGKGADDLRRAFASCFERMVTSTLTTQGSFSNTFAGQVDHAYQRYIDLLARIRLSGLDFKLHPRNGLTIVSEPRDEEQARCKELVDLAQQCNHVFDPHNALVVIVVFLLGIYGMALVIDLGRIINVEYDSLVLYIFIGVLAGFVLFLVIATCKITGKGTRGPFPRSLLLLDPSLVKRLHDRGISYPFADLAIYLAIDKEYIEEMSRKTGGAAST